MKTSTFLAFLLIAPSFIVEDSYASPPPPGGNGPECPCFTETDISGTAQRIINNEIKLIPKACNDKNNDGDGIFKYTLAWEELSTNDRRNGGPPGLINQPEGDSKQYGGYVVTLNKNNNEGYCTNYPSAVSDRYHILQMATCHKYMQAQCLIIDQSVCPCYDMDDMTTLKERLANDEVVMDVEKSCKKDHETLPYGIYLKEAEITSIQQVDPLKSSATFEQTDMRFWGVNVDKMMCFDGSDMDYPLDPNHTTNQGEHCKTLIESICDTLQPALEEDECGGSKCGDDPDYKFRGQTCKQLASGSKLKTRRKCKRKEKNGKFVFETCRDSCQMRECVDDSDFYFNGNPEKNCDWIKSNKDYCADDQVRKYCVVSCGTKCCKDNGKFSYRLSEDEFAHCNFFKLKRQKYCSKKSIAYNCPKSCGKCLKDPR
jgi:hypothetical protein